MKVCVTGTRGIPEVLGGVETHCQHLYPLIAKQGIDVTVLARSPYVDYRESTFSGVSLRSVWAPKKTSIEAIAHTFLAALKAKKIGADIVHIHAIGPGLMVPFFKLLGLKVVFTHHGPDYDRNKWGRFAKYVLRLGEKFAVKFADEVIVISSVIDGSINSKYGRDDAHTIYNGVAPFKVDELNSLPYLRKHGLEKCRYLVAVGRFVEEKGFHDLINAYAKLNTDFKLVIMGDADHESSYSKSLKKLAAGTDGVYLTGFVKGDELKSIFSSAYAFVMPSYHEGLPIALLEALSYGLPVIVSDIPANLEVDLCADDYFSTANVDGLSAMIQRKLDSQLGCCDYADYLRRYDWNLIAEQTVAVYKEVMLNDKVL